MSPPLKTGSIVGSVPSEVGCQSKTVVVTQAEVDMVVQKYGKRFGCYGHPTNGTVLKCGHARRYVQGSEPCLTCIARFMRT